MPTIATSGLASCATISIGRIKWCPPSCGFRNTLYLNEHFLNKATEEEKKEIVAAAKKDLDKFYSSIIYPVAQELGETGMHGFDALMTALSSHQLGNKFTQVCINRNQYQGNNKYWPKRFEHWGFKLAYVTGNSIGDDNYIFVRAPLAKALPA